MKQCILFLLLFFAVIFANAQHGLKNIIVEKYYIADAKDAAAGRGDLPVGSVTYRIFVDMLPAYRFQAAYGVPNHELRISTTTSFFNNEDAGATAANEISKKKLQSSTVMLDSWLSVGAGAQNNYAIPKIDDTSKAVINVDGVLQNEDPAMGIPVKERDGLYSSSLVPVVTFFGIDSSMLSILNNKNVKTYGQSFIAGNGSWASFGGAIGVSPHNKVLIAQLTTDGEFSFKLNIQIGIPGGGVENYVAENPVGKEILFPGLIYSSSSKSGHPERPDVNFKK
jgi:hypothetical protein